MASLNFFSRPIIRKTWTCIKLTSQKCFHVSRMENSVFTQKLHYILLHTCNSNFTKTDNAINPLETNFSFLYPWKYPKAWFFDIFRGYRKGALVWNRITVFHSIETLETMLKSIALVKKWLGDLFCSDVLSISGRALKLFIFCQFRHR